MKERWPFGLCHGGLSVAKYPLLHGWSCSGPWANVAPMGDPSGHPGAQKPPLPEGSPTDGMGVATWTSLASGEAGALLRVDMPQSSETGTVRGLRWRNLPWR